MTLLSILFYHKEELTTDKIKFEHTKITNFKK